MPLGILWEFHERQSNSTDLLATSGVVLLDHTLVLPNGANQIGLTGREREAVHATLHVELVMASGS